MFFGNSFLYICSLCSSVRKRFVVVFVCLPVILNFLQKSEATTKTSFAVVRSWLKSKNNNKHFPPRWKIHSSSLTQALFKTRHSCLVERFMNQRKDDCTPVHGRCFIFLFDKRRARADAGSADFLRENRGSVNRIRLRMRFLVEINSLRPQCR